VQGSRFACFTWKMSKFAQGFEKIALIFRKDWANILKD
jgi:hypothetical protein